MSFKTIKIATVAEATLVARYSPGAKKLPRDHLLVFRDATEIFSANLSLHILLASTESFIFVILLAFSPFYFPRVPATILRYFSHNWTNIISEILVVTSCKLYVTTFNKFPEVMRISLVVRAKLWRLLPIRISLLIVILYCCNRYTPGIEIGCS